MKKAFWYTGHNIVTYLSISLFNTICMEFLYIIFTYIFIFNNDNIKTFNYIYFYLYLVARNMLFVLINTDIIQCIFFI